MPSHQRQDSREEGQRPLPPAGSAVYDIGNRADTPLLDAARRILER